MKGSSKVLVAIISILTIIVVILSCKVERLETNNNNTTDGRSME
jgi:hypothetical protein